MGWNSLLHGLQQHSGRGKTPDESQERPSPRAVKYPQGDRRVGTGDEEKIAECSMI